MAGELPKNLPDAFWRPAGLIYLAFLLAGLACGLWPDWIFPPAGEFYTGPLPALRTLAVAQTAFILLVWPLVALRRHEKKRISNIEQEIANIEGGPASLLRHSISPVRYSLFGVSSVAGTLIYMIATIPFYLAAAYLSDASVGDVVRSAVGVLLLWPVGWAAGMLMARPGARGAILIVMLLVAMGLPAAYYIVREFLTAFSEGFQRQLWLLAPSTFAWEMAGSRQSSILPAPAWAAICWPVLAIAAMLLRLLWPPPAASHQPDAPPSA